MNDPNNLKHQESEKHFRQLANFMPLKVWVADAEGNKNYFNQKWFDDPGLNQLSIVIQIVINHCGIISAFRTTNKRTSCYMYIPLRKKNKLYSTTPISIYHGT